MIELIFVIVIIGILAAVALPKFVGVSEQAKEAKFKAFVGTMNRTVGPTLWSKSISEGYNGSIDDLGIDSAAKLREYTELPDEIDETKVDLTECNQSDKNQTVIHFDDNAAGNSYYITCKDGNINQAPVFHLWRGTKPALGSTPDSGAKLLK